ncbi:hypothetical protein J40TS1_01340 [Paenibacillus montaniterrae]|uniref:Copper amine oxidase-like N-terminal domain-containing protein n=2 Tax=Paenibacillus montaniterrae TaxID=429341 RepID=A0A919YHJ9_9BACL|nr:hypothetical protein J40TS1_01340 [Paenibacillus montaniterrae]
MNKKSKFVYNLKVFLVLAMMLSIWGWYGHSNVDAADKAITAAIDDKKIAFSTPPYQKAGTTLVPFRAIFEALDLKVGWNAEKQQVTGTSDTLNVTLTINSKNAYVNGEKVVLAQAPVVVNGATMVPLRFVAEASGGLVYWDGKKQHIDIVFNEALKVFKAAYYNDSAALKHWLENGYTVDEMYNGSTPLLYAAMGNAWDTVNLLLKQEANPDVKSPTNWTPLLWAAYHQNDDMIKRLLEYGATEKFVTDSSTNDLKLAQTRLANYLNNGSSKLDNKKTYNDSYFVVPFGSSRATVKSKISTTLVEDKPELITYNKAFINGDIGLQFYEFKNGKLASVLHRADYELNDATSAMEEFLSQMERIEKVYGVEMKYQEAYTSSSIKSLYEAAYSNDLTDRYAHAIRQGDLQLQSAYYGEDHKLGITLGFDKKYSTYMLAVLYLPN